MYDAERFQAHVEILVPLARRDAVVLTHPCICPARIATHEPDGGNQPAKIAPTRHNGGLGSLKVRQVAEQSLEGVLN